MSVTMTIIPLTIYGSIQMHSNEYDFSGNFLYLLINQLPNKDRYIIECFNPNTCTMLSIMNELDEHYANRIILALVDRLRKAPFSSLRPSECDWEALV
ncbi:hypothetical protein DERF_002722 [Dermatophagoides farinae]|uniref:Uncharacterized protein n=1 Tax=Dermatophagoides farinae TaxID=6954 RepID=A0A922LC65_DERFA|nr:hypothetical protein DERF_002722 [Dermatophagoides farinae]